MMFGCGSARVEERLRAQGCIMVALCEKVGLDPAELDPVLGVDDAECALIARGKPAHAIKHHRKCTVSTLLEAKQAIDAASR